MLKRIRIFFFMLILTSWSVPASAQGYKHGVGLQMNIFSYKDSYTTILGSYNPVTNLVAPGLVYKASLGLYSTKTRDLTISVSSYPFLGLVGNSPSGTAFAFEVPLLVEFFAGDIDYFGGFLGLGGSFSHSTANMNTYGNAMIIGPQIEGGVQFPIMERVVALRLAYTYGLNDPGIAAFPARVYSKSDRSLFSIGLTYVFGY